MIHEIGSIVPLPDRSAGFAQIFTFGGAGDQEVEQRISAARIPLNPLIIRTFMDFFYRHNPYARMFQQAGVALEHSTAITIRLRSAHATVQDPYTQLYHQDLDAYNRPTADQVMLIMPDATDMPDLSRDIVLHSHDGHFVRIDDLHTGYLPMRFPVVWSYGSQGYDLEYTVPDGPSKHYPLPPHSALADVCSRTGRESHKP